LRERLANSSYLAGKIFRAVGESVVTQSREGLGYFFSNLQQRAVLGLSFFTLSLVSLQQRRSYPLSVEQQIRTGAGGGSRSPAPRQPWSGRGARCATIMY